MNIFYILLTQPLTNGLVLFYRLLWGNMGLAIIGFSVFLRVLLNPLTKPYMESMKKMKEVEPQLAKIKNKYKNDKTKLMKAQTDFYKEKGINPGAGCLPYILQIVVLIALFRVFSSVLAPNMNSITKVNSVLYNQLKFKEGEVLNTHFLYLNLNKPDVFKIPSIPFPIPGVILLLASVFQLISAKMMAPLISVEKKIAKKTPSTEDDFQVAMQQSTTYTFPFFTLVFGLNFPSGLALYWLIFSIMQTIQQYKMSGWGSLEPIVKKVGNLITFKKK